jgi:hypothetical protein
MFFVCNKFFLIACFVNSLLKVTFRIALVYSKPRCHVVSKAFSVSKSTVAVDMLLLKFKVTWPLSLLHLSVIIWRAGNPNWLALSRPLSSMCLWIIIRITFSNSYSLVDKGLIGRKFWGNFGSLLGFSNFITIASFQDFGKQDNRRQWLNRCIICTSGPAVKLVPSIQY